MRLDRYRQYLPGGAFTVDSVKGDADERLEILLGEVGETLFDDDCRAMTVTVEEFEAEYDRDFGDYVEIAEDVPRTGQEPRSRSFRRDYVRAVGGGLKGWRPVKADITLKEIRILYLRFGGKDGLSDRFEVIRIGYPHRLVLNIGIDAFRSREEQLSEDREEYRVEIAKQDGWTEIRIRERISGDGSVAVRSLKTGEKGFCAETEVVRNGEAP